MDVIYQKAYITGDIAAIPEEISSSSDDDDDAMKVKESEEVSTPVTISKKKGGKILGKRKNKSYVEDEKDKNPFLRAYKQTLGNINSRVSGEGLANHVPKISTPSMDEVLHSMVECGAVEGTSLFHTATKIMIKPEFRELFMLIKTKEGRFDWLQREHEALHK